jgi:hypothetical protein
MASGLSTEVDNAFTPRVGSSPLSAPSFDTGAFDTGAFDTGAFDSGAFDSAKVRPSELIKALAEA